MILDISDYQFQRIFSNKELWLPIQWNNKNFPDTLKQLFDNYINSINNNCKIHFYDKQDMYEIEHIFEISQVCDLLVRTVQEYLNGFPAKAFKTFGHVMSLLEHTPLETYSKSLREQLEISQYNDSLNLYRVTTVNENILYSRSRVFHTPYSMRSKVSTNRYSIAGFPSLYLGTSLELCCEEVHPNLNSELVIASRFQLERNYEINSTEIRVIELAIKPQDFLEELDKYDNNIKYRIVSDRILSNHRVRRAYLLWYPLIAACSFIRVNKKDPFAAEYIIPQLLMQWIRKETGTKKKSYKQLVGIRYFSCASARASDMGFNYVFPTCGQSNGKEFCSVLSEAFKLTRPYFRHEYQDIYSWEYALKNDMNLKTINN